MADWKDIAATEDEWIYTGYNYKDKLYLVLQYDADDLSTTKVGVRFSMRRETTYKYYDGFGVLLSPTTKDSDGNTIMNPDIKFYKLKDATSSSVAWPSNNYNSSKFYLTKTYSASKFVLPAFWFINTWALNTTVQAAALAGNEELIYFHAKDSTSGGTNAGAARNYKTKFSSSSWSIASDDTVATNGTKPTVTVTDNGNNTVTISGTLGTNGTNNNIKSAALYYTTDGSDPSDDNNTKRTRVSLTATSGGSYSKTISITSACTVEAFVICVFTYNTTTKTGNRSAKYYAAPGKPGKPSLTDDSYRNGRLTIKQNWEVTWSLANPANDDSPVTKYRFRMYRKTKGESSFTSIALKGSNNTIITNDLNNGAANRYYYDRSASYSLPMTFYPAINNFKAGDQFYMTLYAHAEDKKGNPLWSGESKSDTYTVENAGVVRVKAGGKWVEGQVYVKVNNKWEEAETVNTKVNGKWEESE